MYKIGMIGTRESVLPFMALGYTTFEAQSEDAARELLHTAAKSGEFAVLFLEECYAAALQDEVARYKDSPLPAITVLPGKNGSLGMGAAALKNAMERAVGADIL